MDISIWLNKQEQYHWGMRHAWKWRQGHMLQNTRRSHIWIWQQIWISSTKYHFERGIFYLFFYYRNRIDLQSIVVDTYCNFYNNKNISWWLYLFDCHRELLHDKFKELFEVTEKIIGNLGIKTRWIIQKRQRKSLWMIVIMFLIVLFYLAYYSLIFCTFCYYKKKLEDG